jgi:hypothetical protein
VLQDNSGTDDDTKKSNNSGNADVNTKKIDNELLSPMRIERSRFTFDENNVESIRTTASALQRSSFSFGSTTAGGAYPLSSQQ